MKHQIVVAALFSAMFAGPVAGQVGGGSPPAIEQAPAPADGPVTSELPEQPPTITHPVWLQRFTGADVARHYPAGALARSVSGSATLDCLVGVDGALQCGVTSEEPAGWGFGDAALLLSRRFRMAPETRDGVPTAGGRYRLRIPLRVDGRVNGASRLR